MTSNVLSFKLNTPVIVQPYYVKYVPACMEQKYEMQQF